MSQNLVYLARRDLWFQLAAAVVTLFIIFLYDKKLVYQTIFTWKFCDNYLFTFKICNSELSVIKKLFVFFKNLSVIIWLMKVIQKSLSKLFYYSRFIANTNIKSVINRWHSLYKKIKQLKRFELTFLGLSLRYSRIASNEDVLRNIL